MVNKAINLTSLRFA